MSSKTEPVTMAEIDALREAASGYLDISRSSAWAGPWAREQLETTRWRIEGLLRRWWAQGCREVSRA